MNILLLGSNSLLAKKFIEMDFDAQLTVWPNKIMPRQDIQKHYQNIFSEISLRSFDVVINCIAKTNLDWQEENILESYAINALFPLHLAKSLSSEQLLVHFSTDQMYNSLVSSVSVEADIQTPQNIYARAKLISEDCAKIHKNTLIIRTNFVSGDLNAKGHFISWLMDKYNSQQEIPLFDDYVCSSIDTSKLCSVTQSLISMCATGTLNVGASHGFSKYELGVSILKGLGLNDAKIKKVSMFHGKRKLLLKRYSNLTMNCVKLTSNYRFKLPDMNKVSESVRWEIKVGSLENKI